MPSPSSSRAACACSRRPALTRVPYGLRVALRHIQARSCCDRLRRRSRRSPLRGPGLLDSSLRSPSTACPMPAARFASRKSQAIQGEGSARHFPGPTGGASIGLAAKNYWRAEPPAGRGFLAAVSPLLGLLPLFGLPRAAANVRRPNGACRSYRCARHLKKAKGPGSKSNPCCAQAEQPRPARSLRSPSGIGRERVGSSSRGRYSQLRPSAAARGVALWRAAFGLGAAGLALRLANSSSQCRGPGNSWTAKFARAGLVLV